MLMINDFENEDFTNFSQELLKFDNNQLEFNFESLVDELEKSIIFLEQIKQNTLNPK